MKCTRINCGRPATKLPVISFAAKVRLGGPRASAEMPLPVCDEHATEDAAEFMGDEGWRQICAAMRAAGKAEPDRSTLRVDYRAIQ